MHRESPSDDWSPSTRRLRLTAAVLTYAAMLPVAAFLVGDVGGLRGAIGAVALALLLGWLARTVFVVAQRGTAEGVGALLFPRRAIRRDAEGFSMAEAAEQRGDVSEALRRAALLVAEHPDDAVLCFLVAELYLRHGRVNEAVALLRRLRLESGAAPGDRLRASNRLVDVHLARPDDRGLALRELRTIVREHAQTPAAAGAARLLAELTAELEATRARVRAGLAS